MRFIPILISVVFAALFLASPMLAAGEGATVFETLKCGMCHKADKKAAAVSLADIAKAYPDKGSLVKFFKGETKPIMESEKWGMMRGQMTKIASVQEQEKDALADYVMSFR